MSCIFCKIGQKEIKSEVLFEDGEIIAFKDAHPMAPFHALVIPKKHIKSVTEVQEEDAELLGKLIMAAKKLAEEAGIAQDGYKLLIRAGSHGGQEIDHLHLHLIGGAPLSEDIHPIS